MDKGATFVAPQREVESREPESPQDSVRPLPRDPFASSNVSSLIFKRTTVDNEVPGTSIRVKTLPRATVACETCIEEE
jgi:hypothetical protein